MGEDTLRTSAMLSVIPVFFSELLCETRIKLSQLRQEALKQSTEEKPEFSASPSDLSEHKDVRCHMGLPSALRPFCTERRQWPTYRETHSKLLARRERN